MNKLIILAILAVIATSLRIHQAETLPGGITEADVNP